MAKKYIAKTLRQKVISRAKSRCEYCQTPAVPTGMPMEIDHIIPASLEGQTTEDNLCLSCSYCNDSKNDRVKGLDPETRSYVDLFNPRRQNWNEHFAWSEDGTMIVGLTPIGRATINTLNMNPQIIVKVRQKWFKGG